MLKSLINRIAVLGMVGATFITPSLVQLKAWALPTEEIVQTLNPVPVFIITDKEGTFLTFDNAESDVTLTWVFLSVKDAMDFVSRVQEEKPDLADKVGVVVVPLSAIYMRHKQEQNNEANNGLNFLFIPNKTAVEDAKNISGAENGQGVPLFVAAGKDNTYLTIEENSQQVIPFFFEKQQLEQRVEQLKNQNPELAATVKIEVVPLEGIIQTLESSEEQTSPKIRLVPSLESRQLLQQSRQQQQQQQQQQGQ